MDPIYTLTLSPSLDCATSTAKLYPEGKLRCTPVIYQPGGAGLMWRVPFSASEDAHKPSIRPVDRPENS